MSSKVSQPQFPSAARIYDFFLGGTRHYDVDAEAGRAAIAQAPFIPDLIQLQHRCIQTIAHELTYVRGYDVIVDFASGLPTETNFHHHVAPGTTVVYSDIHEETVAFAHEILANEAAPDVCYVQNDIHQPFALLEHPEVAPRLQGRRDIVLVAWGITLFMDDQAVRKMAQELYEWATDQTCWVMNFPISGVNTENPAMQRFFAMYDSLNEPLYARTVEACSELVRPWVPEGGRFRSIVEWNNMDPATLKPEVLEAVGPGGGSYGAFLRKEGEFTGG
jgi:hypothetical protein